MTSVSIESVMPSLKSWMTSILMRTTSKSIEQAGMEAEGISPLGSARPSRRRACDSGAATTMARRDIPSCAFPVRGCSTRRQRFWLAQLVERRGVGARSEQPDALSLSRISSLDTENVTLICLCYIANTTSAQIGYAIRRIRRKAPDAFVLVSLFGSANTIDGLISTAISM